MSDFIARIAARAVGAPAIARPRLPAFFGAEAARPEIADEPPIAPVPARAEEPRREVRTREAPIAPDVKVRVVEKTSERAHVAPPPSARETVLSIEPMLHERETAAPVPAQPVPQPREKVVRPVPAVTVQATPVVVQAAARAAALPAPAAPSDEPLPVRVHIGRLEVRANLQQAPAQQPRREPPRAQGLTLAEYLRGKREAG